LRLILELVQLFLAGLYGKPFRGQDHATPVTSGKVKDALDHADSTTMQLSTSDNIEMQTT